MTSIMKRYTLESLSLKVGWWRIFDGSASNKDFNEVMGATIKALVVIAMDDSIGRMVVKVEVAYDLGNMIEAMEVAKITIKEVAPVAI